MLVLLLGFVTVHELGHTIAARISGDPGSTFYFVKIDENGTCLGCNITDHTLLTQSENLLVSLAGMVSTQVVGMALMIVSWGRALPLIVRRWALGTGLSFVVLDTFVQGVQGLLYDIEGQFWPTNVDLVDVMLLLQNFFQPWPALAQQTVLKISLATLLVAYLLVATLFFQKTRLLLRGQAIVDGDADSVLPSDRPLSHPADTREMDSSLRSGS